MGNKKVYALIAPWTRCSEKNYSTVVFNQAQHELGAKNPWLWFLYKATQINTNNVFIFCANILGFFPPILYLDFFFTIFKANKISYLYKLWHLISF